ncbi:carboxymuconolactone decarboxylase family protein [Mycolicibacterium porcinum]|uniref:Carboxymuconolactone decarboxylase family protein n=1 Tax=Mycolicibacterium porcinum TaxID=39693 RepID=A0AAW5T9W0_9MYCO|nr:carboxymuconolactone decarboxylase family protein [Mycolicibacterium porcinum]MCV7391054.1 carboxymuconolactone decarboxylase family protein [Mycolicibacterium porcinum]ORB34684.1 carboxymuconolactone decarboxylase family protein [Mycolicibacterium porcinum]CDO29736.1 carboxymuconolactone decarboxylase [Mycolicibacterium vulneris]
MTAVNETLGGRLPLVDPAGLTPEQQDLAASVRATQLPWAVDAGFEITSPDGRLIGPFNAFLHHPEIASRFLAFSAGESRYTTLSERIREIVILAVGGVWAAEYELYAHSVLAANVGIDRMAIQALAHGEAPTSLHGDELIAAELAQQLSKNHRIDEALYRDAEAAFGRRGLFDIVALMGQYLTVSALLSLFEVPAPG